MSILGDLRQQRFQRLQRLGMIPAPPRIAPPKVVVVEEPAPPPPPENPLGPPPSNPLACVQYATCEAYEITREDMNGPSRTHRVTIPRQLAMYLARDMLGLAFPEIGRRFKKDHTTVLHGMRITDRRKAI